MIASFIFLGLVHFALCADKNERKLSDSDAHRVFSNHSNLNYENSRVSHQNESGPSLFNSGLNHNNQFTKLNGFVPYNQGMKSNQFISNPIYSGYVIPNSTTFGKVLPKSQGLPLQASINNFYLGFYNQPFTMNQASFKPVILSQNPSNPIFIQKGPQRNPYFTQYPGVPLNKLESNKANEALNPDQHSPSINNQNALVSNPQPFPFSSGQIQNFQSTLIGSNLRLDHTEEALTRPIKSNHEIDMDLGDHKVNIKELNQSFTGRKSRYIPWKAYELNNLLKGVNEYDTQWKKILNSYEFEEERTSEHLYGEFSSLKRRGRVVYTKEAGWKFVNRGELTDLVRGEEENEQIQGKRDGQGDIKLAKSKDDLSDLVQHSANEILDQEQEQKGLFFVRADKKRPYVPWKDYEIINLIKGVNAYGEKWKIIHELLEFEQGRTLKNLYSQFYKLKKDGKAAFTEDFGWKLVNKQDSDHSSEKEATGNQRKGQKQKRLFFAEKDRKHHYLPWKKRELENLLKGANKYGRNWKKTLNSYEFEEGRTNGHLYAEFRSLEKRGQITYEENFGWKFTDLYKEKIRNKVVFEGKPMKGSFNDEKIC